jgi:hypothetical protein
VVEQLGMHALLPGPPLVHQRVVQPAQAADLGHVRRRDPRFGEPALQEQGAQQPGIGAVGLGAFLRAPLHGDLGRIPQMHTQSGGRQLLADIAPPGAALQRELRVAGRI